MEEQENKAKMGGKKGGVKGGGASLHSEQLPQVIYPNKHLYTAFNCVPSTDLSAYKE